MKAQSARNSKDIKAVDVAGGSLAVNTTGTVALVNGIAQGAAPYQRIGREIAQRSLLLRFQLTYLRTAANQEHARVLLVYDRAPNGVLPTFADVIQSTDSAGVSSNTVYSNQNLSNANRFLILRDWSLNLMMDSGAPANGVWTAKYDDQDLWRFSSDRVFIKLGGMRSVYSGATAGIGDLREGAIYLISQGTQAAGGEGSRVDFTTRLRYTD